MAYAGLRVLPTAITAAELTGLPKAQGNLDAFGRRIDYLRISITDRCNLRCVYCMPAEGAKLAPQDELLTFPEIARVAAAARRLGFVKFRISGGEPLVVRGVLEGVALLRQATGDSVLALSTNGMRLVELARPLRQAGISRVNISLDTLRPERFAALTRRQGLGDVLGGIEAALGAGFERVKLNVVIVRGINDDELTDLASLAQRWPVDVRFIEQMPLGRNDGPSDGGYLGAASMLETLRQSWPLTPVAGVDVRDAAASLYTAPGLRGRLGLIAPRSQKFCANCNRLRLTPHGELKGCLLSEGTVDIRQALRAGLSDVQMEDLLRYAIGIKPLEYRDQHYGLDRPMSAIGG